MKYKIYLLVLLIFLNSCENNDNGNDQLACAAGGAGELRFNDTSGDASFSFIDVVNTRVVISQTDITVTIGMLDIPVLLTYNNQNVPYAATEYSWEIMFDTNCDGHLSGDTGLSVKYFRFGSVEKQGALLDFTQHNVWRASEDGSGASNVGNINATLEGNNLILKVNKDAYETLSQINNRTSFRIVTIYNSSGTYYFDSLPDGYPSEDKYTKL